jgi:hypothetical protein
LKSTLAVTVALLKPFKKYNNEKIQLKHLNIIVSDPDKTAAWMYEVFDWPVPWQGPALGSGRSVHVGSEASYVALYCSNEAIDAAPDSYHCLSGLNHIGVVVADLDLVEAQVRKAGLLCNHIKITHLDGDFISKITTRSNMD